MSQEQPMMPTRIEVGDVCRFDSRASEIGTIEGKVVKIYEDWVTLKDQFRNEYTVPVSWIYHAPTQDSINAEHNTHSEIQGTDCSCES